MKGAITANTPSECQSQCEANSYCNYWGLSESRRQVYTDSGGTVTGETYRPILLWCDMFSQDPGVGRYKVNIFSDRATVVGSGTELAVVEDDFNTNYKRQVFAFGHKRHHIEQRVHATVHDAGKRNCIRQL